MLTAANARCQSDILRAEQGVQYIIEQQRLNPGKFGNVAYMKPRLSVEAMQELRKRGFIVGGEGDFISW